MKKWLIACAVLMLTACGGASLTAHKGTEPELKLEQFFDGELRAYGMVLDRSGNLIRRFEAKLLGSWQGNSGKLEEWFEYDDGEKQTRVWYLEKLADNRYSGRADDVVGIASGTTEGSVLYWQYELQIPVDGTVYDIKLDDWMFLMDEKRLFNKTDMSKWGFHVGELVLFIEKVTGS